MKSQMFRSFTGLVGSCVLLLASTILAEDMWCVYTPTSNIKYTCQNTCVMTYDPPTQTFIITDSGGGWVNIEVMAVPNRPLGCE